MNMHDFPITFPDGRTAQLADYVGQVLLLVNVASKCGLTPQYEGLEKLQQEFGPQGLQVIGFPCNQFGGQEPGTDGEIAEFCETHYAVSFPLTTKIDVNGEDADPLWQALRSADEGEFATKTSSDAPILGALEKYGHGDWLCTDAVKWNFTKFLVGRDGQVVRRYEPTVTPERIAQDLPDELSK